MKFKVPAEVVSALKAVEKAKEQSQLAEKAAENARLQRELRIDELRKVQYDELYRCAEDIAAWCRAFDKSAEGKALGQLVSPSRLRLFVSSRYWLGEPSPAGSVTTCDTITLNPDEIVGTGFPILWLESLHKGMRTYERSIESIADLVFKLHPGFLKEVHAHLSGKDAWKFIIQELERRAPRKYS